MSEDDAHLRFKRKVEDALRALQPLPEADNAKEIDRWIRGNGEKSALQTFKALIDFSGNFSDVRQVLRERDEHIDYLHFLGDLKQTFDFLMEFVHRVPNKNLRGAIGSEIGKLIYGVYVSGMYVSETPLQKAQKAKSTANRVEEAKQQTVRANWQKEARGRSRDFVIEREATRLRESSGKTIRVTPYAVACAIKGPVNAEIKSEEGRRRRLTPIGVDGIRKRIAALRKAGRLPWVEINASEDEP